MQDSVMQRMWQSSHISGGNAAYVEEMYERYLREPNSVPEQWREYFAEPAPGRRGSRCSPLDHS